MNFRAILFRDIKLLEFIKYITAVFTQNNRIIRFFGFLRVGSSDSLSDQQSWSSDSFLESESAEALSSPLASFFTLSNAPKLLRRCFFILPFQFCITFKWFCGIFSPRGGLCVCSQRAAMFLRTCSVWSCGKSRLHSSRSNWRLRLTRALVNSLC